jgi:hypothetical protein
VVRLRLVIKHGAEPDDFADLPPRQHPGRKSMLAGTDDREMSSSSSPRSSLDLIVYPPPIHHEGSEETTAFLSNHEPHDAQPLKLERTNEDVGDVEVEDLEAGPSIRDRNNATRWTRLKSFIRRLYKDNIGLLLIVAAQSFFACMNLFVKLLTALDKPVPALEVRHIIILRLPTF